MKLRDKCEEWVFADVRRHLQAECKAPGLCYFCQIRLVHDGERAVLAYRRRAARRAAARLHATPPSG